MRTSKSLVYVLVFALALAGIGAICAAGAPKALAEPGVTMTEYHTNPVYDPPIPPTKRTTRALSIMQTSSPATALHTILRCGMQTRMGSTRP